MPLRTPSPTELAEVAEVVASWQRDVGALRLHPGDIGWFSMRGAESTAAALRTWTRDGDVVAVGLLDGPDLLRLALRPDLADDEGLAGEMATDIATPAAGILGEGEAYLEARGLDALTRELQRHGWVLDEPWTSLRQDLSAGAEGSALAASGLRVVEVAPDGYGEWGRVHWSAFKGTPFGDPERDQVEDWLQTMSTGPLGHRLTLLSAADPAEEVVAVAGVWTAGEGRPGLIEPLGVHADHRGKGYGVSICQAAASTLQRLGCSSAAVCTESSNRGAVAAYLAAGFRTVAEVRDLTRR